MRLSIILLLILSFPCLGQYPRRANVAIIETDSLFASRLFQVCMDILQSEGYQLNRLNYTSLSLSTDPVEIHTLPLLFKLEVKVEGTLAAIRGYIKDNRDFTSLGLYPIPQEWEDAAYRSLNGSTWRTGFEVVVDIVEKIRSEIYGKVYWDRW
jgi:hypothetical protein